MKSLLLTILALFTLGPSAASAGSYEILQLGDGEAPGTYRVSLVVEADTLSPCPDDRCAWCCGGHYVTICPAPVDAVHAWEEEPVEGGVRIYWEFSNPDEGYCWLDLDPAQTYTLSDGLTWGTWQAWEGVPQVCGTSDLCRGEDDAYASLEIVGPSVGSRPADWSSLKTFYRRPPR